MDIFICERFMNVVFFKDPFSPQETVKADFINSIFKKFHVSATLLCKP